jgi:hypothetical protein
MFSLALLRRRTCRQQFRKPRGIRRGEKMSIDSRLNDLAVKPAIANVERNQFQEERLSFRFWSFGQEILNARRRLRVRDGFPGRLEAVADLIHMPRQGKARRLAR